MKHDGRENMSGAANRRDVRERERVSIEQRVQMLYAQSGGPERAAQRIEQLMHKHLLYGKDHGRSGSIETYRDVIEHLFQEDRTLGIVYEWIKKTQFIANVLYQTGNYRAGAVIQAMEQKNQILDQKLGELLQYLKERDEKAPKDH